MSLSTKINRRDSSNTADHFTFYDPLPDVGDDSDEAEDATTFDEEEGSHPHPLHPRTQVAGDDAPASSQDREALEKAGQQTLF